ncbi:MAG: glycosyltransferase family 2 protein [Candidatus Scalinduaceae bacterium]
MKFSTALRQYSRRRIEKIKNVDIIVGIPSYNNDSTISHVIKNVSKGLSKYFPDSKALIMIGDGGSTDDTREETLSVQVEPWIEKLVTIYRGIPGKGSALRAIFEAAEHLGTRICVVCDSDIRSITPEWIKNLTMPIHEEEYQFVAPYYERYKYDGTITNNIVYNLTRTLYGLRVRQPIGGDFAFSRKLVKFYNDQEVWETDVARYGIDIWLTTTAIIQGFRICQTRLGTKIHDVKDPSESLGPMFQQVVTTLFVLMEQNYDYWKDVKGSKPVPILGEVAGTKPDVFDINLENLVEYFKTGLNHFGVLWENILEKENFKELKEIATFSNDNFSFPTELWCKILYDVAVTFHNWKRNRVKLINMVTPLYFARIAGFVNKTRDMTNEEAEQVVEEQAEKFENAKDYLLKRWAEKGKEEKT